MSTHTSSATGRRRTPAYRARVVVPAVVLGGLAIVAAACSSSSTSTTSSTAGSKPSTGAPSTSGSTVTARLTEYHISLSRQTFSPGQYTFTVENAGSTAHSLEITGPGVSQRLPQDLQPGQSGSMTVTFSAGTYDVFCPVDGHKGLGMNVNLTVGGAASGAASTPTTMSTGGGGGGSGY